MISKLVAFYPRFDLKCKQPRFVFACVWFSRFPSAHVNLRKMFFVSQCLKYEIIPNHGNLQYFAAFERKTKSMEMWFEICVHCHSNGRSKSSLCFTIWQKLFYFLLFLLFLIESCQLVCGLVSKNVQHIKSSTWPLLAVVQVTRGLKWFMDCGVYTPAPPNCRLLRLRTKRMFAFRQPNFQSGDYDGIFMRSMPVIITIYYSSSSARDSYCWTLRNAIIRSNARTYCEAFKRFCWISFKRNNFRYVWAMNGRTKRWKPNHSPDIYSTFTSIHHSSHHSLMFAHGKLFD